RSLLSYVALQVLVFFFFSSRRRHTRFSRDWSSDVCSSDLIYAAAQKLLGDELSSVVTSLVVSGQPDLSGNLLSARGCVPHACGSADGFIVVDKAAKAIFIAQMGEDGVTRFWPDRARWPDAAAALLPQGF